MKRCIYCENIIFSDIKEYRQPWDQIILESSNFVVTPTLGALMEGWTLIISKRHVPAMGALNKEELCELQDFSNQARKLVEQEYGSTVIFEHGAVCEGTNFGCGIDHAHFHIVPLKVGIIPLIEIELNSRPIWEPVTDLYKLSEIHQKGRSYLYILENNTTHGFAAGLRDIPSQLMRRVIASYLGIPQLYNYHEHYFRENVIATSLRLTNAISKNSCLV